MLNCDQVTIKGWIYGESSSVYVFGGVVKGSVIRDSEGLSFSVSHISIPCSMVTRSFHANDHSQGERAAATACATPNLITNDS